MTLSVWSEARTVGDVLDGAAERFGNRLAVQDTSGSLTFAELRDRARSLATGLVRAGLRPGDRVLEALPNGCELLVSELALALAGLIRVPLNPRLGPREWLGIQADSGARALIGDARLADADGTSITDHVRCDLSVRTDDGSLADLMTTPVRAGDLSRLGADDVVALAYSSGTTGMPKGALRTHRMRLASMRAMLRDVVQPTGDAMAYLHAGPAIHTSGLFVLPMLALGARQVMAHHPRPADIAELIAVEEITHLALVPSVIDALSHLSASDREPFARLRMLAYAGAPMPVPQIRRAAELLTDRLVQYYGLVEAIPPLTVLGIEDHARGLAAEPELLTSAGRIVREARVEIAGDADFGEVTVSGPMVTTGYWNAAERSDLGKAFEGETLRTGDMGVITDGYLFLTDRKNDMVISGGYNVYPGEIEAVASLTPGLRTAVVVGLPDERWGQRIVLAYTTTSGTDLDATQRAALRRSLDGLARHKRPKSQHFVTGFPLGATGKIDRRVLAAQLGAGDPSSDAFPERFPPL